MIEKNPFVEVPEKQMERLWSMARATASLCGICSDHPYEEEKAEKLKNGVMKRKRKRVVKKKTIL